MLKHFSTVVEQPICEWT